jgi:hypothetical protein
MKLRLDQKFVDYLLTKPETGMGYQKVNITMKDGTSISNVHVENSEFLITDETIDTGQIQSVTI